MPLRDKVITGISFSLSVLLFVFNSTASADELILENGDRLSGTITEMTEGTLTLKTGYSEPIKIQKPKIKRIFMRNDAVVKLSDGEVLKGKIDTDESGSMYIESTEARGKTTIDWGNVAAINAPSEERPVWKGSVTLGANAKTGNTSSSGISLGAEATRRGIDDRISFRFLFNYAKEDGVMTTRNTYGALKYDYFFTKAFFGYLSIELLNDKFKDLSLRAIVGPGAGYQIWEDPVKTLSAEAGLSFVSDDFREADDNQYLSGRFAGIFSYRLWDAVSFSEHLIVYPNLDHIGRYKLRNEAGVSSALGAGWALKLTNIFEHDSHPPRDVRKNDNSWLLGMQYSF
ncbi:MAG: DUF481 domain-containing protein [Nitrospirota bacterium]|nr:DUF481 domain-containing protein [Nitrospirota bacterium]